MTHKLISIKQYS